MIGPGSGSNRFSRMGNPSVANPRKSAVPGKGANSVNTEFRAGKAGKGEGWILLLAAASFAKVWSVSENRFDGFITNIELMFYIIFNSLIKSRCLFSGGCGDRGIVISVIYFWPFSR